jgi:NADPH:quinone reductase-like Zn-dependent oxidoreductase
MKAVQIFRHGSPLDVLELVDLPEPAAPIKGEVLIKMIYSPVNHYDLRTMRGIVPSPPLPSVIGSEGVAKVLSAGSGVAHLKPGDLVHLPHGYYGWCERLTVPAANLVALPPNADLQQLAMLRVNPPTAALLLSEFVELKPGDWVIQNAANSAVGRCVIAFSKARGFRTVNLVRRAEAIDDVRAASGDVVLVEGNSVAAQVADATGKADIKLGLDGVGSLSTAAVTSAISPGGTLAMYSSMSEQPAMANPMDVIFRDISIRGFWLSYPRIHISGHFAAALREAAELIAAGKLSIPVTATYPLSEVRKAISESGTTAGKVLLKLT